MGKALMQGATVREDGRLEREGQTVRLLSWCIGCGYQLPVSVAGISCGYGGFPELLAQRNDDER